ETITLYGKGGDDTATSTTDDANKTGTSNDTSTSGNIDDGATPGSDTDGDANDSDVHLNPSNWGGSLTGDGHSGHQFKLLDDPGTDGADTEMPVRDGQEDLNFSRKDLERIIITRSGGLESYITPDVDDSNAGTGPLVVPGGDLRDPPRPWFYEW